LPLVADLREGFLVRRLSLNGTDTLRARLARRPRMALLATLLLLVVFGMSCTHPAARRLQGQWVGESVENVDLSQLAMATGWARGLRFEFDGSMATIVVPTELPRSGPFRVLRASDRAITVAIERPDQQLDTATFALDTARTMRWQIGDGRSIVFRRQD